MKLVDVRPRSRHSSPALDRIGALDQHARLRERAQIVADVAAAHADSVDRDAVYPAAAMRAAKQQGLLALLVPVSLGGEEVGLAAVADVCYTLGQACASTAMIVAMHQAALACIVNHRDTGGWHDRLLRRVLRENLLFASSTTEGSAGGNVRASAASLAHIGDKVTLERDASVVSYGAYADAIVTTARRDANGTASDQALVVFLKDENYRIDPTNSWDTFGMRGTCSAGIALKATGFASQILPVGYATIHPQSMVPVSHLTWAATWTGIAAAAVTRAQTFVRTAARRAGGQMPPGAAHYTQAAASLRSLRGIVSAALSSYEMIRHDPSKLGALETQAALNLLKVEASERAIAIVSMAMRTCGLAGYRNDGDFAVGRHLRDILSAPIMVHNDRILSNIAATTLMSAVPTSLAD